MNRVLIIVLFLSMILVILRMFLTVFVIVINKPSMLCEFSGSMIAHRTFLFFIRDMTQTQFYTENQMLPSTIVNMKEHYRLVSILLAYSALFFLFIFSVFFTVFNSNEINAVETHPTHEGRCPT
jgi:hypothetical protein